MPLRERPRVQVHWLWPEREVQLRGDAAPGEPPQPILPSLSPKRSGGDTWGRMETVDSRGAGSAHEP